MALRFILTIVFLAAVVQADFYPDYIHFAPKPYAFGYNVKDIEGNQYREETGDGTGGVKGSYGFTDARGIQRQVNYVADAAGFRAQINTNEPGTANQDPAAVKIISTAHPYFGAGYGLLGAAYTPGFVPPPPAVAPAPLALAPLAPAPLAPAPLAYVPNPVVPTPLVASPVTHGLDHYGAIRAVKRYDSRFGLY